MSVNGVTGAGSAPDLYNSYGTTTKAAAAKETAAATAAEDGVIYEKSGNAKNTAKTYTPNTTLVNKMKADAEARTEQMRSLVEKLISKQGNAYGAANDMWKFLASGKYTVDAATKAQAKADIAEDGYWGVNQTSDRILDFAKALTGGDPDKMEEMRAAFKKGFKQATGAWGKDLPSISNSTYDAVMEKFDKFAEDAKAANGVDTQ